jgi:hypothetical protein
MVRIKGKDVLLSSFILRTSFKTMTQDAIILKIYNNRASVYTHVSNKYCNKLLIKDVTLK